MKRHLFSFIALFCGVLTTIGWWRSTRVWTAQHLQTPFGFLHSYSESSLLVVEAQYSVHENRWSAYSNADPIEGDFMQFPARLPLTKVGAGQIQLMIPYWEIVLFFATLALLFYFWTARKKRRYLSSLSHSHPQEPSKNPE